MRQSVTTRIRHADHVALRYLLWILAAAAVSILALLLLAAALAGWWLWNNFDLGAIVGPLD